MPIVGKVSDALAGRLQNTRQHMVIFALPAGVILVWLVLLVFGLQMAVITVMFDQNDAKWSEAITAGLGLVSNSAAKYLGFSANIRTFTAKLIAQQDDIGHLPEQHCFVRTLLFFVRVPNQAIGANPPIWWTIEHQRTCCGDAVMKEGASTVKPHALH